MLVTHPPIPIPLNHAKNILYLDMTYCKRLSIADKRGGKREEEEVTPGEQCLVDVELKSIFSHMLKKGVYGHSTGEAVDIVILVPPVRRPPIQPLPSTMIGPESPLLRMVA